MSSRCRFAREIADDVSPFARRGERDRARALANGEAFDGLERNIGLGRETLAERLEHPGPHWAGLGFAGDADEQRRGGGRAAVGVHSAAVPGGEQRARREFGSLSGSHERSKAAPPAAVQDLSRTAGLLAHGVSPTPPSQTYEKVQWREKRRHAAHSRGGGHGSTKSLPCSLFTLGRNRGTVRWSCSSFGRGCQMERETLGPLRAGKPGRPWPELGRRPAAPNSEERPARASAGNSSSGLGGEPRGPNNVRSSHNAVSLGLSRRQGVGSGRCFRPPLKDALPRRTAFRRIGAPFHAATGRSASWVAAHGGGSRGKDRKIWR